ncbi:MAG: hypothetical protein ACK5JR_02875 [Tropicimonas sp.]|uniref:hypothetical protein n=1 Tax=Tropicimonas sp. TaxID=2067044 RepID=UPI003A8403EB
MSAILSFAVAAVFTVAAFLGGVGLGNATAGDKANDRAKTLFYFALAFHSVAALAWVTFGYSLADG